MKTQIANKYIKPKSLTWWVSLVPILAGGTVAAEPLHGLVDLVTTIRAMTGDLSPAVLINAGLAGIGIRGALK